MIGAIVTRSIAALAGAAFLAAPPVGLGPCTGVRPGAPLETEGSECTFNFMFKGSDGHTYAGTAGHCFDDTLTETRSWLPGTGPVAELPTGQSDVDLITGTPTPFGRWVYKTFGGDYGAYRDFGLIQVDPGVPVEPGMCHFGGPTGTNTELTTEPVVLHHYGNGRGFREAPRARTAVAPFGFLDRAHVYAEGVASPGDSGSGVIDDSGRAVGLLVAVGALYDTVPPGTDGDEGIIDIVRLAPVVRMAEQALGIRLRLLTAEVAGS